MGTACARRVHGVHAVHGAPSLVRVGACLHREDVCVGRHDHLEGGEPVCIPLLGALVADAEPQPEGTVQDQGKARACERHSCLRSAWGLLAWACLGSASLRSAWDLLARGSEACGVGRPVGVCGAYEAMISSAR